MERKKLQAERDAKKAEKLRAFTAEQAKASAERAAAEADQRRERATKDDAKEQLARRSFDEVPSAVTYPAYFRTTPATHSS